MSVIAYRYELPAPGVTPLLARERFYLDFITRRQLKDEALWRCFVGAFRDAADEADHGWRGEYWGKMMRGACLVYRCTADAALYEILRGSVLELLSCAAPDGRISSYPREDECVGWDLWCRKYVLTGMLHFCDICPDPALRERILDAMEAHLDRLIDVVGPRPWQKEITLTSDFWLGVNSCSILEPVLDLYRRRPKTRFLRFAQYILSTGGCSGGDLVALALEDRVMPFEYPENKAYETMSFFEGVLAYYETTGERRYLDAAVRFAEAVYRTEITLIGCAGCNHEQFDHAVTNEMKYSETVMQETCVTVTWMRLCARLFLLTGEPRYAARVEQSALNALYGSVNLYDEPIDVDWGEIAQLTGLPFDSYSPLYMNRRGRVVGGLKFFADGSFYGCCVAIGAAGLALAPLIRFLSPAEAPAPRLCEHRRAGKLAFTYGPYTLARDEAKEGQDISVPVTPLRRGGEVCYEVLPPEEGESVRLRLKTETGTILLTDYASCGKHWSAPDSRISVWLPEGERS